MTTYNIDRKPIETTIRIKEGATGYSYKNLFYPYLKNARHIKMVDPYVRYEYQIKNFLFFCEMIAPLKGNIEIHLITQSDNEHKKSEQIKKLDTIQQNLVHHRIKFTYEFNDTIHDRSIETNDGWRIKSGRGLDFFQKPFNKYELGELDQKKRKCRETEIDYLH